MSPGRPAPRRIVELDLRATISAHRSTPPAGTGARAPAAWGAAARCAQRVEHGVSSRKSRTPGEALREASLAQLEQLVGAEAVGVEAQGVELDVGQPAVVEGPVGQAAGGVPRLAGALPPLADLARVRGKRRAVGRPPAHPLAGQPPVLGGLEEVGAGPEPAPWRPPRARPRAQDHLAPLGERVQPGPEGRNACEATTHGRNARRRLDVGGDALGAGEAPEVDGPVGHARRRPGVGVDGEDVGVVADDDLVVRREVAGRVQPDLVAGEVVAVVGTLHQLGPLAQPRAGGVVQVGGRAHHERVDRGGQRLDLAPDVGAERPGGRSGPSRPVGTRPNPNKRGRAPRSVHTDVTRRPVLFPDRNTVAAHGKRRTSRFLATGRPPA